MTPTFKKVPRATGLARITDTQQTEIKINKVVVGYISKPYYSEVWTISIKIICAEHPGWRWMRLVKRPDNESLARTWLLANWQAIQASYQIYTLD